MIDLSHRVCDSCTVIIVSCLFYYDCCSATAIVPFPITVSFSCNSCTAIARCIALIIVRLLFGDCFCYFAITVSLSRLLDVRFLYGDCDSCIASVVLSVHF